MEKTEKSNNLFIAVLIFMIIGLTLYSCMDIMDTHEQDTMDLLDEETRELIDENTTPLFVKVIHELEELSGIAASKKNPGIFWTHDDGKTDVYALDREGNIENVIRISYRIDTDIEDLALGNYKGEEYIFVGDVGDNDKERSRYQISMIKEPEIGSGRMPQETLYNFVYSDGNSYDCESLVYTPYVDGGSIYLITKDKKTDVFKLEVSNLDSSEVNIAEKVGRLDIEDFKEASAADIRRDGLALVIRNDKNQLFMLKTEDPESFEGFLEAEPIWMNCPPEPDGEAVAFDPFDRLIYTASEEQPKIVYEVDYDPYLK